MNDRNFGSSQGFPFEHTIRRRYSTFRARDRHGLSSLSDLVAIILGLAVIIALLTLVLFVLVAVLLIAPFLLLAMVALRWLGLKQKPVYRYKRQSESDTTIIDLEAD